MIVKSKYVSARRVASGKARSALKSHLKYLQYRERDQAKETREDRYLFSKDDDHVDRKEIQRAVIDEERAGDVYYHRLILSPSEDEPISNWQQWTREVMSDLERYQGKDLEWYAVIHQNTDNPHVHVVLRGTGENRETGRAEPVGLYPSDFVVLKESGREHSDYDYYQQIKESLQELERYDYQELYAKDIMLSYDERS